MSTPTQYNIELTKKFYDNKYIDYHIDFLRDGLNAVIKKWLNNGYIERPKERANISKSEFINKNC